MATVVRDGTVVTATDVYSADIRIESGLVSSIGKNIHQDGDEMIDASGMYVFPGGVDVHCHLGDDYEGGTIAAAHGGTTCIVEPIEQKPGQSLAQTLRNAQGKAGGASVIDYGFHLTIVDPCDSTLSELDDMVGAGVSSFKLFLAYPHLMVNDADLLRVMLRAKELRAIVILHAENGSVINVLSDISVALGNTSPRYGALSRPKLAEAEAVCRGIALAQLANAAVFFYHISSEMALIPVRESQDRGLPVFAETCPHYLFLTEDKYQTPGFDAAKYLCAPPLRDVSDQTALWNALATAHLQVVSSDHVGVNLHDGKDIGRDDFRMIPGGMPGIESRLPLLYSGVTAGRISLRRFVDLVATMPAKVFGMYPGKGTIAIGSDADLVVFDPAKKLTLGVETLHQRVDYSPYEGLRLQGAPSIVISRGNVIVRDGAFVGEKGAGRYLRRDPFSRNRVM